MSELISVLLPVYNAEEFLEDAIQSILSQSYSNLELILIDDGSSDKSMAICERFVKIDPRVRLIVNSENLGIATSLNKGIEESKGNFIARMDADDISLTDRLEKQLRFLESNLKIAIIGTSVRMIDIEGNVVNQARHTYLDQNTLKFSSYFINPFFHGSIMARSEVLRTNLYDSNSTAEDFELWLRLCLKGIQFANLKEELYHYRLNFAGYSKSNTASQNEGHVLASKYYLELLLSEKLSDQTISILNCRPNSDVRIKEVFEALNLFKRIKKKIAPGNGEELLKFVSRQRLDIFIQSSKRAKNSLIKLRLMILILIELANRKSSRYMIQKIVAPKFN